MIGADRSYRPDIDGLRALAVAVVLIFHAFPASLPGGFVGVDVFFVISGYLISGIILEALADGPLQLTRISTRAASGAFFRRWRWCSPACWSPAGSSSTPTTTRASVVTSPPARRFASNFAFWRESSYFDVAADLKPLLHLWSLGVEEQFYLVWPLAARHRLPLAPRTAGEVGGPLAATRHRDDVVSRSRSGRSGSIAPRRSMRRGIDSGSCSPARRSRASRPMPCSSSWKQRLLSRSWLA